MDQIPDFWERARSHIELNRDPDGGGTRSHRSAVPAAWSFGAGPDDADGLLALVLAGTKTATSTALRDIEAGDEEIPAEGELSIILDGAGRPRALIRTTRVRIVPFGAVDAAHAAAEGEGDRSLPHWRAVHRRFFRESGGAEVPDDLPIVVEEFEILYRGD